MSTKIPIIDFSNQDLKPDSPEWDSSKARVREALEEYGCFEAMFDQVLDLRKPVFGAMERLFELPLRTKQLCVSDKHFRGYRSTTRLFENMSIDDAHITQNMERFTDILWSQGNLIFSETMTSFTKLASRLEETIKRMILESFGLEKYLDELVGSTNYQLRVMKYGRPRTNIEPTLGAHAHHDQNFMTLLYQNEIHGLEIQTKDGQWIIVQPSSNSFVVMIGESFSVWLNGRLSSPYHRVVTEGNKARYTIGLFAMAREGYLVKVPEELVDEQNRLLFKPFEYEEFLGFYHAQIDGGAVDCGLKLVCLFKTDYIAPRQIQPPPANQLVTVAENVQNLNDDGKVERHGTEREVQGQALRQGSVQKQAMPLRRQLIQVLTCLF